MSTTPDAEVPEGTDRTIPAVAVAIGACAGVFAVLSFALSGGRMAFAVVVGGAIAVANFLVLSRVVKAITGGSGGAGLWGGIYFLKIAVLFGGLYLLLDSNALHVFGLLLGLASLVPGIVVGGVVAAPKNPPAA